MSTKWNISTVYLVLYTIKLIPTFTSFYTSFNKEECKENVRSLEDENNDFSLVQNIYIVIE